MISNGSAMRIAAAAGILAVALGAFGAHGLEAVLEQNQKVNVWHTAVFYHFIHTLMLVFLAGREPFRRGAYIAFLIGILIFSGSLYVLAVTNLKWLGAITPIGGTSFIVGWVLVLLSAGKEKARSS